MKIFELLYSAPIPVGHRVEMSWYHGVKPHDALLRDMDSGIVYGPAQLFGGEWLGTFGEPSSLSSDVNSALELQYRLEGKVLACRLATRQYKGQHQIQTTLTVEPDLEGGAYR